MLFGRVRRIGCRFEGPTSRPPALQDRPHPGDLAVLRLDDLLGERPHLPGPSSIATRPSPCRWPPRGGGSCRAGNPRRRRRCSRSPCRRASARRSRGTPRSRAIRPPPARDGGRHGPYARGRSAPKPPPARAVVRTRAAIRVIVGMGTGFLGRTSGTWSLPYGKVNRAGTVPVLPPAPPAAARPAPVEAHHPEHGDGVDQQIGRGGVVRVERDEKGGRRRRRREAAECRGEVRMERAGAAQHHDQQDGERQRDADEEGEAALHRVAVGEVGSGRDPAAQAAEPARADPHSGGRHRQQRPAQRASGTLVMNAASAAVIAVSPGPERGEAQVRRAEPGVKAVMSPSASGSRRSRAPPRATPTRARPEREAVGPVRGPDEVVDEAFVHGFRHRRPPCRGPAFRAAPSGRGAGSPSGLPWCGR